MTLSPAIIAAEKQEHPCAVPVWPDLPGLWQVGTWHPGELRTARYRHTGLLVLGQCLAGHDELSADLRVAVDTDRLDTLGGWPGSYTIVLLHNGDVTARVDLAGQFPLYHRFDAGRTVIGSSLSIVGGDRPPDVETLAAQIFHPDVTSLVGDRSVLDGVFRLGGGQALRVGPHGRARTWTVGPPPPDDTATLADAAAELRTALDDAVRARIGTGRSVTADLSGGMDSTSVAFLAAGHTGRPIPVFTYHHPDAPTDDLSHARYYATLRPNFVPETVVGSRTTLAYHSLRPMATDIPDPAAFVHARTGLRLERVAAHGSGVHLGGEGADALLVPSPGYLADLARRGELRTLARHSYALGRGRQVPPATVFRAAVRAGRTSMSRALIELAQRIELPAPQPTRWLDAIGWWPGPGVENAWLTTRMRSRLAESCRRAAHELPDDPRVADAAALHDVRTAATVQRRLIETGREHGVWPHAPFLDDNVILACTRVTACRRTDPAVTKALLATALRGLVPDPVFTRRSKGNYRREDYLGLRSNATALAELITDSRVADLDIVRPKAVLASIERARIGVEAPFPALNRLLSVELWLRAR